MKVMVLITAPEDYISWDLKKKIDRQERVMEWHTHIRELAAEGRVLNVWGTRSFTSRVRPVHAVDKRVVVYSFDTFSDFDRMMAMDPLRDVSRYQTIALKPLSEDRKEDIGRVEVLRANLISGRAETQSELNRERARFYLAPSYVGKQQYTDPPSPTILFDNDQSADEKLEVLVFSTNPKEFVGQWDDVRKTVHAEMVSYWHDYIAKMINDGIVTHAWAAHDFLDRDYYTEHEKGKGAAIYRVDSWEEFDEAFGEDPIRDYSSSSTVVLKDATAQMEIDQIALDALKNRLR
ncbi:hypothetical protein RM190_22590 [Paracoccus sp. CPCC 101403]|uniref:Uncharacterized protein n=1 Tax=Paracoccus broussonetiae TaxID=3075834 RepID=A0ABU3EK85_9RHOB|nr:hypothetical protein [Paracoccus sp. CPCC 101403]MDT1064661.1 hypothetical protein [Paracoccus sp. CPCC 101403]